MNTESYFIHIKPKKGWQFIDLKEIKEYRDLLSILVIRDIKIKYKQTIFGFLWAVIQPLFSMLIFTIFFGRLGKMPSDNIPYPLFCYSAMILWTYLSNSIVSSGNSLVNNSNLLSKVYFPRIIIPIASVLSGLIDLLIAFVLLLPIIVYYGMSPLMILLSFPITMVAMVITASGVGILLAALNAKYRDIRYAIPFLVQIWMFASPIVYPASLVPEGYRLLYALNPMTGVIESFRSAFIQGAAFPWGLMAISSGVSVTLLILGLLYFKQTERYFADII